MAQWLKALAALVEDPSSVPNTHNGQLTTTCNSILGDTTPSSGLGGYLIMCDTHTDTHIHIFFEKVYVKDLYYSLASVNAHMFF